jgi:hypothetical protein
MIAFNGQHLCACAQERSGEAAGAGTNFIYVLASQAAGNCGNAIKQLFIEQKILAKRLACGQTMSRNDVSKGRERHRHPPRSAAARR